MIILLNVPLLTVPLLLNTCRNDPQVISAIIRFPDSRSGFEPAIFRLNYRFITGPGSGISLQKLCKLLQPHAHEIN